MAKEIQGRFSITAYVLDGAVNTAASWWRAEREASRKARVLTELGTSLGQKLADNPHPLVARLFALLHPMAFEKALSGLPQDGVNAEEIASMVESAANILRRGAEYSEKRRRQYELVKKYDEEMRRIDEKLGLGE